MTNTGALQQAHETRKRAAGFVKTVVWLSGEQRALVEARAARDGVSVAEIVRRALALTLGAS